MTIQGSVSTPAHTPFPSEVREIVEYLVKNKKDRIKTKPLTNIKNQASYLVGIRYRREVIRDPSPTHPQSQTASQVSSHYNSFYVRDSQPKVIWICGR